MIVYEVNLWVQPGVLDAYHAWLDDHVREILALPGFTGATVFAVLEPAGEAGQARLCVQYRLDDEAALSGYLREHAPRLRAEGMARFGGQFHAERRVLESIANY